MEPTSPINITVQDNFDGTTGTLSTPPGTEHIPPVRPAPVNASTQPEVNAATTQAAASQQPEKIHPCLGIFFGSVRRCYECGVLL